MMPPHPDDPLVDPRTRPTGHPWAPFVAVMLVLGALAVAPLVTSAHVRRLRAPLTDVVDRALLLVNDLEATLAAELYAADGAAHGDPAAPPRYRQAHAAEVADLAALAPLVARVGEPASRHLSTVTSALAPWHGRAADVPPTRRDDGAALAAIDAAQQVERDVERFADGQRQALHRFDRLDVWVAGALVPVAAIGVVLLTTTSWRMSNLAAVAERRGEQLAVAAESRERLLRGVSHDLRNPLGAASGFLAMLDDGVLGALAPAQRDAVTRANRLVRSALQTAGDLLDLARADAGHLPVYARWVELRRLVREVVDDHAAAAGAAGLRLVVVGDGLGSDPVDAAGSDPVGRAGSDPATRKGSDPARREGSDPTALDGGQRGQTPLAGSDPAPPPSAPVIWTDPDRVRQVLTNLLSNAVKYTPAGGRVEVRVVCTAAGAPAIEVCDTGPGIPPADRERVFEEAVRLPGAHEVAPGAGIGLAAARRLARALGGDLTADDAPTGGARFTLALPAAPAVRRDRSADAVRA